MMTMSAGRTVFGAQSHGRRALAHDESEAAGYGAYGYILFSEAPSDPRSQVILQGYQTYISRGDDPQRDPSMANITYLLVDHEPPSGVPDVAWLVAHYDVGRAKTLLRSQQLAGRGPFLMTSTSPLSATSEPAPRSSIIDLENLSAVAGADNGIRGLSDGRKILEVADSE